MSDQTPKDLFLKSVNRCIASDGFLPSFYERFLASSDEIKRKFRNTDFEKQNEMLARSLQLSAAATAGDQEALAEMNERATTHDRHHLNIEPQFYEVWLETIVATASNFDDQWSDEIEAAWQRVLSHVVQHMIRKY